ncbi:ATP-binding cassette domain-containing protein [Herbiconiux sp. KACC 21604]|uniref:ABC transporter ATP-binding protein n=1 Tax=unclassified Herbiconiux TaxID=2618217 RepID=UPI0014917938|nr:ATP-binding cassette domain-containing protein [Herbiconiux sp. SALV-R1]QJU54475.1 ATP-binding cassette domain-containing protein [Herbiconiux sp. SALV-R1]WPO85554.1 ATP-binding cassette domain-containing protein [Herbiconiux sp. KACC 21604]
MTSHDTDLSPDAVISARALTKRFLVKRTPVDAVTGLDLDVAQSELVAFLGPNGAGKSTSLRMLTTLLPPTSGRARVAGHDIATEPAAVRRRIGYIGQGTSGGHNQRVRDELLSQGAFYGLPSREAARRADSLLESLDLAPLAKRPVSGLSGGQKRRLDIALGLIHSPALLFLDEPSTGLDPQSRANLWEHIRELREQHGTTVFVTTHYLEEADQYAERVLVMDQGRVIADADAATLKAELAGDVLRVRVEGAGSGSGSAGLGSARAGSGSVGSAGAGSGGVGSGSAALRELTLGAAGPVVGERALAAASGSDDWFEFVVDGGDRVAPELVRRLDQHGLRVTALTLRQPTLDDVFLALTGRSLRDSDSSTTTAPETALPNSDSTSGAPQPHDERISL